MRKRFLGNLFFVLLVNLLVKPAWIFGIDRTVQNTVGPEVYGTYFAVFNFSFLFHILLDFGINQFNNREVSQRAGFAGEHLASIVALKMLLSFAYLAITFLLAWISGFSTYQFHLLEMLTLNLILLNFILYLRSNISARQHFILDGLLSVLDRLLAIIFCGYLIFFRKYEDSITIDYFIYAQTLALMITFICAAVAVLSMRFKLQFNIPRAHLWKLLKQSAPFALLGILMTLYYRLDGYMIERMLGAEGPREAGVYAASYRLFDAANMIPYLFSTLLLPMFSRMLSKQEDTGPLAILSGKMLFVFASLVSVVCFVWSNYWMKMLYHGADEEWNRIFRMLMISYIPVSMVYVHGTILLAKGALKKLNLITFSGLIINLVLNLLLIPRMHALGATLATLCTQIFVSGCFLYFSSRVAALNISVKSILQYSFYPILIVLLAYLLADESVNRWLGMTVVCIMAAAFAFILGIFRISEFKSLVDMGFKAIKPREGVD